MPPASLNIAVVGAGTAGPAVATLLARGGHVVTLFERAERKLPVGAGFLLQPTGMAVLREMGLLERLLPLVAPIRRLLCLDRRERLLLDLNYDELSVDLRGAGTHRATLLDLLLDAAERAGAVVSWNCAIATIARARGGKPRLIDGRGREHGPFDLVLLCDGAQSSLRAQAGIPCRVSRYPWGALWFIGRRPAGVEADTLWQRVGSTRELVGLLPTGTPADLVSLFWSVKLTELDAWRAVPLESWKHDVLRHAAHAEPLLAPIEKHSQLAVAVYHDVRMERWHGERVAVLGDAGHALSPQLGQGVNLALMDAATFAGMIERYPLDEALARYSRARRAHLKFYQWATRWTTPLFQSDAQWLGAMRDVLFPLAGKIPWVRRQMIATMAGYKTGAFSEMSWLRESGVSATLERMR